MRLVVRFVLRLLRPTRAAKGAGRALVLAAAGVGAIAGGCAAPTANTSSTAELRFENLTEFYWEIDGRAAAHAEPYTWRLPPHHSLTVQLPAGHWVFAQSVLPNGPIRNTQARLEAGETYVWPLATLLSGSKAPDAELDRANAGDD